jgi:hypothetical protein
VLKLDELKTPPAEFRFVLLERVNPAKNAARFYYLAWQATLFETGAVVRVYGRKSGFQRSLTPRPFFSLAEAWPLIRRIIQTRLRHGYQVIQIQADPIGLSPDER